MSIGQIKSVSLIADGISPHLFFHKCFQSAQRLIPLPGYLVQRVLRLIKRARLDAKETLTPLSDAPDEARIFQNPQVFRDRLARDSGAFGQLCDGMQLAVAELHQKVDARRIAEGRKERRLPMKLPDYFLSILG